MSLDSMHKKLSEFYKKFTRFKNVNPKTAAKKDLKRKVFDNNYIYKEKYEEEKDGLNDEDTKKFESEEEEKETDKKPDKKESPRKSTKNSVRKFSDLINKEETPMNKEVFQKHFNFARPSALLKELYRMESKKKKTNKEHVDLIKSGLRDLEDGNKRMSENEIEIEKPGIMVNIIEKILEFNRQNQER